ncbi:VOC family protein [Staphylococcus equorum]|uniref:VOC family protein n=1 Tax=Staphylococcus equorum TaxID=246432 RepID=A0A9X4LCE8_9STAP|nr:VOC family protein [Staphylococcus equorum]MDG0844249.1 VOC family protein [Staphylococcus equorum]MDG0860057.1 VOC family protein [Staphylococcus equorum]
MENYFLGIDHVQVAAPANRESQARAFYSETLGFKEITKPANLALKGGMWFQVGQQQLHVGVEDDFAPTKKAHPAFLVHDASDVRKLLESKAIEIIYGDELEGADRFYIYDSFGNRIEIIEWL